MSIFRETFKQEIKESLGVRQTSMVTRNTDSIQYLNSRNSWIRMTSSVNIAGSNAIAEQNVLLGGALDNNKSLRSGVGGTGNEAYSNKTTSNIDYRLGIRPMPGITSIDVKSKSAYGSLREVVVHFQCWDIRQLEELELLYMRPGYTVLIEWGWFPYIQKGKNGAAEIVTKAPAFYDIINKSNTELSTIAKELYEKSLKSGGNYDATFGYIKNYQWSARPDGGYDCQTTVISTGEIIESLKVNYVRPDLQNYKMYDKNSLSGDGYLNPEFATQGNIPSINFVDSYEKNTLAGIWTELFYKLIGSNGAVNATGGILDTIATSRGVSIDKLIFITKNFKFSNVANDNTVSVAKKAGNEQVWITLDVVLEYINKYITAKSKGGEPLVKLSILSSNITSENNKSEELLCLAHPLQVSVDPTVCLIRSPLWYQNNNTQNVIVNAGANTNVAALTAEAKAIVVALKDAASSINTDEIGIADAVARIVSETLYDLVNIELAQVKPQGKTNLQDLLNDQFGHDDYASVQYCINSLNRPAPGGPGLTASATITSRISTGKSASTIYDYTEDTIKITKSASPSQANATAAAQIAAGLPNALHAASILNNIPLDYFYNADPDTELGIIRNIYVNLDFLYRTSIDANIESQDHKEKNEISLYKYVKSIMTAINSALGSMNNFEVHVDPIDNNTARIIDINYTSPTKPTNLFELQVHNLNSVVRNYSLQSQIFPEQGAMIAIGSQVKGGQLGIQNNTMIDFNNNLVDRIIPTKEFPQDNSSYNANKNIVGASLANIILLFSTFEPGNTSTTDVSSLYAQAKSSLRDIIVYFQSIVRSSSSSRSIIPIKFSFEMDGIGGLVIGHLFKTNQDILPRGYKRANLAQTITGISHTIGNSDWTTKIDALNIILEDPALKAKFSTNVDIKVIVQNALDALVSGATANTGGGGASGGSGNGGGSNMQVHSQGTRKIDDIYQIILHNTEGYGDANETLAFFTTKNTAAHYIIDRGGNIVKPTNGDLTQNLVHADNANHSSVGIELCNIDILTPSKTSGNWISKCDSRDLSPTARAALNRPQGTGGVAYDLGWKFLGYQYHEDYTDAQMASLKLTLKEIISKCPNILNGGKLNYTTDNNNILETVWQLPLGGKAPTKGTSYTSARNVKANGAKSLRGIYSHTTTDGGTHGDTHPSPKLIKILQELKSELGA
jgi:hypothetical protein